MLTRDEIRAVYAQGPNAVVGLVEQLQHTLAVLTARVEALESRLGKDSHNSHKPPSSDGLSRGKKPKSLRGRSGKPSGGQPGHPGTTLLPVETPDARQVHTPSACAHCGSALEGIVPCARERRQVFDLPPLSFFVTEHEAETVRCRECRQCTSGTFPTGVTQAVQYGPGVRALSVYLQSYQLLPYARTQELLRDLFGASPCQGTLARALEEAAERLEPVEEAIRQALHQAAVAHFDETGIRAEAKLLWLHGAGTERLSVYAVHPKRGRAAHEAIGILPGFCGTAVHDAYASFFTYEGRHALCNAHLLRELIAVEEETRSPWATAMILLLQEMKQAVETARSAGEAALSPAMLQAWEARYRCIVEHGSRAHPPPPPTGQKGRRKQSPARNLLDRLARHRAAVLAFLYDFAVPFDNNLAERDLRMAKVQQKISGGFRSIEGAQNFCRIRGYISTLRKQGPHVLSALQSVFAGTPLMPQLQG